MSAPSTKGSVALGKSPPSALTADKRTGGTTGLVDSSLIRNVWQDNLEEEMMNIQKLLAHYPCVAMDTEFPGVVARPLGNFRSQADYLYASLRCNVDMLRIIQLGLALCDEQGNLPQGICCWQFNFRFSLDEDAYAQESIDLLAKSGIDFAAHERRGIFVDHFGALLTTSGLIMMPGVTWISFHSIFDFGYLVKILTCNPLPLETGDFLETLSILFPSFYDIKLLMRVGRNLKGGLQDLADDLQVSRIGTQHQAGSDALLTAQVFFKLKQLLFTPPHSNPDGNTLSVEQFTNQLYGLCAIASGYSGNPFLIPQPQATGSSVPSALGDALLGSTPPSYNGFSAAAILSSPLKRK
jgi:CCR4-NOT transcription complex subunit 7/8